MRRSVRLHQTLHPDVRRALVGTWLADHGQQLAQLAKRPKSEQAAVVALLFGPLDAGVERPKTVQAAVDRVHGVVPSPDNKDDRAFAVFLSLWRRSSPAFRRRVREFVRKEERE